jgi:hypothetical protein
MAKQSVRKKAPTQSAKKKTQPQKLRPTTKAQTRRKATTVVASIPPLRGATESRVLGGVCLDIGKAGSARVKRMIYPPGFRWSTNMKPVVGTDLCMHAHVGYLAQGEIHIEYWDGCVVELKAPQILSIEPGHDGWVVGRTPVIMIEFDFERDTLGKLGMPNSHSHP